MVWCWWGQRFQKNHNLSAASTTHPGLYGNAQLMTEGARIVRKRIKE